jgi:proteasome lid subunit RPN8/RPN11
MQSVKVTCAILEDMCQAASNTFPHEFVSLVGSSHNSDLIDELIVIPAVQGESHAWVYSNTIPFDPKIRGSIHSHPSANNFPSQTDLESFRKLGMVHFIVSHPFSVDRVRAFDFEGNEVAIQAID